MIRVLVVDDQAMVRQGFAALLGAQPGIEVVGDAADGAEGVRAAVALAPDVVLMDVRMPVLDGIEATRRVLAAAGEPPPRVLILTTFDLDDYVYAALRAGASGFLLKDARAEELVQAVRVVAAGDALLAPTVTRRLIAEFAARPDTTRPRPDRLRALTPRETEVLTLIAGGLSNAEIAERLVLAEQTVKTHVGRILTKLDLRDRAQAVVVAYESGAGAVPGVSGSQPVAGQLAGPWAGTPGRGRGTRRTVVWELAGQWSGNRLRAVIRNVVVGRVRSGVAPDEVERALQELRDLRIEGLEFTLVAGQDLGLRPGGASYAITVDLPDEQAYRVYDLDAAHNRIRAEFLAPITESVERVQFRLPG